jgi:hypothetical protein
MARDERIIVRLQTDKKQYLQSLAEGYGITMSALCAFVLGQWLNTQQVVVMPMIDKMTSTFDEEMKKEFERTARHVEMAIQQDDQINLKDLLGRE